MVRYVFIKWNYQFLLEIDLRKVSEGGESDYEEYLCIR